MASAALSRVNPSAGLRLIAATHPNHNAGLNGAPSPYGLANTVVGRHADSCAHGCAAIIASCNPDQEREEYIRQSLLGPHAHLVKDYDVSMTSYLEYLASPEEINDLVAFLLTQ